ncbi:hypothetical protein [Burkholderia sp. MSMB1589WGS]|uniref:hypothetical protein n=1 Tax=Burkholderia sp. MSMB1589WGS TaxID=1636425 RepID=UPI0012E836E0|nr:hypothetical protein [Burkholderia sp. MSMB1589WGS]
MQTFFADAAVRETMIFVVAGEQKAAHATAGRGESARSRRSGPSFWQSAPSRRTHLRAGEPIRRPYFVFREKCVNQNSRFHRLPQAHWRPFFL